MIEAECIKSNMVYAVGSMCMFVIYAIICLFGV